MATTTTLHNPLLPKLLDRYIFKQLIDFFLMGVVVFSLVAFFSDALFDFINDIQKFGIPLSTLLTIIGLQLPKSVSLVIPASCFMAVLIVYNTLNNNFELISVRMNGVSLYRLIRPALIMGLLSTAATYLINDYIVPYCNAQTDALKQASIRSGNLPYGRESFMYKAYDKDHNLIQMIYVGSMIGKKLGDSTILDLSNPNAMQVVQAKAGLYDPESGWAFDNANIYVVSSNANSSSAGHSKTFRVHRLLDKSEEETQLEEEEQGRRDGTFVDASTQNFWQLLDVIQRKEALAEKYGPKHAPQRKAYLSLWDKLALPLSSLVIILSAVALAIQHPRQGNQLGYVMALAVLFLYYILRSTSEGIGRSTFFEFGGLLSKQQGLFLAAWTPLLLMTIVGFWLLAKKSKTL